MTLIQTANSQVWIFFTDSLKNDTKSVIWLFLCANTGNIGAKDDIWWNCIWMHKLSQLSPKWLFIVVNIFFVLYLQPFLSQSNVLTLVQQYLYSSTAQILGF